MAFPNNCNPRIINVDASTGCTLSRASIRGMTPQDFEDQGFKELGMDRVIARAKEAKVAGVIERPLESLLMSNIKSIKGAVSKQQIAGQGSVILPYIYMRQRRNINSNYWRIANGAATPGAGTGGLHAGAWDLTIQNSGSKYASALVSLEQYFLPGRYVLVEAMNATTKVAYSLSYKILAAVNANSGLTQQALVTLIPNYTGPGWAGLTAAQQLTFQPTSGVLLNLANSVSDYESWCYQDNAENVNKLLTFWLQTTRETHEYSDEYLLALNAALTTNYFKDFRQLPLAQQKAIQHAKAMAVWMNSVFYGQQIDETQTVETYQSLPKVVDPMNPSCTLEFKANALGLKQQLINCSRYLDHQGNALSMDNIAAVAYDLKRAREATGASVDRIDFMTDRFTSGAILQLMTSFYKAKYGINTERFYQPNQKLTFEDQTMWNYNVYQLPDDLGGLELAIYTDPYFSDKLLAFDAGISNRGRTMWGIDWSDFYIGMAGTNSANRQTNVADNLYNCVIRPNVHHYQLNSQTWTTVIEDPARHYLVDNFSNACPALTVAGCSVNA